MSGEDCFDILSKFKNFESMDYDDFNKRGSHKIEIGNLSKEAADRLVMLKLDDYEELYSLRITGKKRVWCIHYKRCLMGVLWWDPEHKVFPSKKKHT